MSRRSPGEKPRSRPATSKLAARRFTSHSHGPGQGLVEVVEVEQHLALRRGEHAEVQQVGVAAELHVEARTRRGRQVCRHDERRATIEGGGEASIRPWRMGTSSGTRLAACSSSSVTGSGRSAAGAHAPCVGAARRAALRPSAAHSCALTKPASPDGPAAPFGLALRAVMAMSWVRAWPRPTTRRR